MAGQLLSALFITAVLVATGESLQPLRADIWLVVFNGAMAALAYTTHYKALELGPVAVVSRSARATPWWASPSPC